VSQFNDNVINGLATTITTAQGVQDNTASTGKDKVAEVAKLTTANTTADENLKLYYNTQCQKLADEYTTDTYLNIEIEKDVTVLAEGAAFVTAFEKAEEVYVSVKSKEETYDVSDVILARKGLETAATALKNAYEAWKTAAAALNAKIAEATTELAAIQAVHATTYDALNAAKAIAQDVYDNKKTTTTADLEAATKALDDAIKAAIAEDTEWSFTDATPEFKLGKYEAGKVTYTRTGSAIAEGKYGSFCLPFEVATENFTAVYVPAPFAIYNTETDTYKMFFKKVTEATIAPNTPFLAKLCVNDTLVLRNSAAVEITEPVAPNRTNIEVYKQSAVTSFVEFDPETKFVWNGTLAKKEGNTDIDLTFGSNGVIYKAGGFINPFRAYLQVVNKSENAKIIVDFGDDDDTTGIEEIIKNADKGNGKVYSVDGKFVGDDTNGLGKGIYIINGKKVIK